jgi:hypothetical protein
MISSCTDSASFDTQIALYKAEDCADWASFELVASGDDQCGRLPIHHVHELLGRGATYLIQVEGWGGQTGDAYISVSTLDESDISADAQQRNVTCPLDKDFEPMAFCCLLSILEVPISVVLGLVLMVLHRKSHGFMAWPRVPTPLPSLPRVVLNFL